MKILTIAAVFLALAGCNLLADSPPPPPAPTSSGPPPAVPAPPQADPTPSASASTHVSPSSLVSQSQADLRVLRNEIFARHGRAFQSADLQAHFAATDWYEVDPDYSDDRLSDVERANVALIASFETDRDPIAIGEFTGDPGLFFTDAHWLHEVTPVGLYEEPTPYEELMTGQHWRAHGDWIVSWYGEPELDDEATGISLWKLDYDAKTATRSEMLSQSQI